MWAKSTTGAGQMPKTTVTARHRAIAATVVALTGAWPSVLGDLGHEREGPGALPAASARAAPSSRPPRRRPPVARRQAAPRRRQPSTPAVAGPGGAGRPHGEYMRRMTRR